jgi:chemotaxis protein histidine kinase CheA
MSGETGLEDFSLIDLFRSEVETHSELLSAALLALERTPSDTSRIDEMMRAAHSIKGAARVVGVEPAINVAHVMEDCFVAAQRKVIGFTSGDIDVLLRGVDLLTRISSATRNPNLDLAQEFSGAVQEAVAELQAVLSGSGTSPAVSPELQALPTVAPVPSKETRSKTAADSAEASAPATSDVTILVPEILDATAAEVIRKQVLAAIDSGCSTIRFDLRATTDLDVQGLALLAALPSHLARAGRTALELAGASHELMTVLRVTGLAASFGVRRDLARGAE